jgi:hypothetical protein
VTTTEAPNYILVGMKVVKAKPSPKRTPAKTVGTRNAELLKLAKKRKPPQKWYEEQVNPFSPRVTE